MVLMVLFTNNKGWWTNNKGWKGGGIGGAFTNTMSQSNAFNESSLIMLNKTCTFVTILTREVWDFVSALIINAVS